MSEQRRAEIAANLDAVRERLSAACRRAGRDPSEVTIVAVTKTRPAEDVLHLAALGVRDIGENRDQEAAGKAAAVRAAGVIVRWHFVGRLQRNKCPSVVRYADMVHSVDSVRLATALAEASERHRDSPLDALVQVSLDGDPARGGAVDAGSGVDTDVMLDAVVQVIVDAPSLRLRGLMAVAPLEWEPARAYALLAGVAERVRREHPDATVLSAGMSGDVEEAIDYGATHVRLGTALLGNRPGLM